MTFPPDDFSDVSSCCSKREWNTSTHSTWTCDQTNSDEAWPRRFCNARRFRLNLKTPLDCRMSKLDLWKIKYRSWHHERQKIWLNNFLNTNIHMYIHRAFIINISNKLNHLVKAKHLSLVYKFVKWKKKNLLRLDFFATYFI